MKRVIYNHVVILLMILVSIMLTGCGEEGNPSDYLDAPMNSLDATEMTYDEVVKQFEDAGFTNVKTKALKDLETTVDDGVVKELLIDGRSRMLRAKHLHKDVDVIIEYHSKKYPSVIQREGYTMLQSFFVDIIENNLSSYGEILGIARCSGLYVSNEGHLDHVTYYKGPYSQTYYDWDDHEHDFITFWFAHSENYMDALPNFPISMVYHFRDEFSASIGFNPETKTISTYKDGERRSFNSIDEAMRYIVDSNKK